MVSRAERCAAGGFSSDFYFDKAIMICRVRLRFSSYLLLLSVRYFLISPRNLPSAVTGEVLGSCLCRGAPPPSAALRSQPTGCWLGSARLQRARPGGQDRGSAASTEPAGLPLPWHSALARSGRTRTLQVQRGALATATALALSSWALCLAGVFDRAFSSPSKTGVLSLLHCAALKLFSCGLLSQSAGPICFL